MAKFSMLQTASVLLSFEYVSGHGYTTWPPARQYCTTTPIPGFKQTKGCKQVGPIKWEPQSIGNGAVEGNPKQVVPTKICGAGNYPFLDHAPASDWKTTLISPNEKGRFTFKYHCTACHRTSTWEVYQTTKGWTGQQELRWSDLKPFCRINVNGAKPPKNSSHDCPFPEHTGNERDMIVVLWDRLRRESGEMWFHCSDVKIEGGHGATTTPTEKFCDCPNGVAPTGSDCPENGKALCNAGSCIDGYENNSDNTACIGATTTTPTGATTTTPTGATTTTPTGQKRCKGFACAKVGEQCCYRKDLPAYVCLKVDDETKNDPNCLPEGHGHGPNF